MPVSQKQYEKARGGDRLKVVIMDIDKLHVANGI